ncbi:hypothetical protein, partial [Actinobacillus pleuropneumoniae]
FNDFLSFIVHLSIIRLSRQRQHFLAPLPGREFFCPWRFNDIHILISHHSFISRLSWKILHFLASFGSLSFVISTISL